MRRATPRTFAVSRWTWAGLAVLAAGLGTAAAALGGFGSPASCGSFGMGCIVTAFAITFFTLCAAAALLLWGLRAQRSVHALQPGPVGRWRKGLQWLTAGMAAAAALAALVLGGFAVMVLTR